MAMYRSLAILEVKLGKILTSTELGNDVQVPTEFSHKPPQSSCAVLCCAAAMRYYCIAVVHHQKQIPVDVMEHQPKVLHLSLEAHLLEGRGLANRECAGCSNQNGLA